MKSKRSMRPGASFARRAGSMYSLLVLLVVCLLAGCQGPHLMPTPNVYVQTQSHPFANVAPPLRTNTVDVLYATDRQPVSRDDGPLAYGYGRSPSLAVGSCVVEIGQNVSWDTLVEQSQQAERSQTLPLRIRTITEQVRFPATPMPFVLHNGQPTLTPEAQAAYEHTAEQVRQEIRRRLTLTPHKAAYVYVHGYNNTFEDGAVVIAELWHFLGRQGVPILYTWPAGSGGGLRGYTHDRESGEFTVFHLKQFLRLLASIPELEQLHLIAHSRGTDVLTSALRELYIETYAAGQTFRHVYKIRNVVLAAADLDLEVVTQRLAAEYVGLGTDRTTIYVSDTDKAIGFSGCLFMSFRRIGQLRPEDLTDEQRHHLERVARTQLIDARVPTGLIGHAYFYRHPAVSADLILLLRDQLEPGSPGRPLQKRGANFWQITPGYPGLPDTAGR
jgi:esterase/lipase superfamily enzyme